MKHMLLPYALCLLFIQNPLHAEDTKIQQTSAIPLCNGFAELCNRRYNEVAYLTTHNSQSYKEPSIGTLWSISAQNQDKPISQQLADGVRAFKIPLHKEDGIIKGCHGMYKYDIEKLVPSSVPWRQTIIDTIASKPCYLDPAATALTTILKEIKKFLDSNKFDVITLFLEDTTKDHAAIAAAFSAAKLEQYLHSQDPAQEWPFLSDMIKSNKRLVVFIGSNDIAKKVYPWLHPWDQFIWRTQYSFGDIAAIQNNQDIKENNTYKNRKKAPRNKIAVVQHFITPAAKGLSWKPPYQAAGDKELSKKANKRDILAPRLKLLLEKAQVPLNFIWVDFYEYGDVTDVINELNAVGHHATKPLYFGIQVVTPAA